MTDVQGNGVTYNLDEPIFVHIEEPLHSPISLLPEVSPHLPVSQVSVLTHAVAQLFHRLYDLRDIIAERLRRRQQRYGSEIERRAYAVDEVHLRYHRLCKSPSFESRKDLVENAQQELFVCRSRHIPHLQLLLTTLERCCRIQRRVSYPVFGRKASPFIQYRPHYS